MWYTSENPQFVCGPHLYTLLIDSLRGLDEYDPDWFGFSDKYIPDNQRRAVISKLIKMIAGPAEFEQHSTTDSLLHYLFRREIPDLYESCMEDTDEEVALYNRVIRAINEFIEMTDDISYQDYLERLKEHGKNAKIHEIRNEKPCRILPPTPPYKSDKLAELANNSIISKDDFINIINRLWTYLAPTFDDFMYADEVTPELIKRKLFPDNYFTPVDFKSINHDQYDSFTKSWDHSPLSRLKHLKERLAARKIIRYLFNRFENAKGLRTFLWKPFGPMALKSWDECANLQNSNKITCPNCHHKIVIPIPSHHFLT